MAIRMRQTVKTANGIYEGGDIITGLSPVLEAQLIDGGSAVSIPGDVSSVSQAWNLPTPVPVRDYIELMPVDQIALWDSRAQPAGCTWTQDTSVLFDGRPTIRLDIPAATTGGPRIGTSIEIPRSLPLAWDGVGLTVAMMSSNLACVSGVNVLIPLAPDFAGWYVWSGENNVAQQGEPEYVANEWMVFSVTTPTANGTAGAFSTLDGRRALRISFNVASVGTATSVWLGLVAVAPRRKPTVILSCDDGYKSGIDFLAPLLRYYNLPCNFGVSTQYIGQTSGPIYMNEAELQALHNDPSGLFELFNHGVDNNGYDADGAAVYAGKVAACRAYLESIGVRDGARHHAWVQGQFGTDAINLLKAQGMLSARTTVYGSGQYGAYDRVFATGHDKWQWLVPSCIQPQTGVSVANAQTAVTGSITAKVGVTHVNLHDFGTTDSSTPPRWTYDKMSDFAGWLAGQRDAGNCDVMLWGKWHAKVTGRTWVK